jgi:hypothetical protein
MTKLIRPLEVIKGPAAMFAVIFAVCQIPADSQSLSLHEAPKQGELSEISDISDVSILHGAPETTTNRGRHVCHSRSNLQQAWQKDHNSIELGSTAAFVSCLSALVTLSSHKSATHLAARLEGAAFESVDRATASLGSRSAPESCWTAIPRRPEEMKTTGFVAEALARSHQPDAGVATVARRRGAGHCDRHECAFTIGAGHAAWCLLPPHGFTVNGATRADE